MSLEPTIAAYRRKLTWETALAATIAVVTGGYGLGRIVADGLPVAGVPGALTGVALVAGYLAWRQGAELYGEIRHPRIGPAAPLREGTRRAVYDLIGAVQLLTDAERDHLGRAYRAWSVSRWHELAARRAMLSARWSGRLRDTGDDFGVRVLHAVENCPAAVDAVLAVLVADIINPDDYAQLTLVWRSSQELPVGDLRPLPHRIRRRAGL
jgi:hypothetical protein